MNASTLAASANGIIPADGRDDGAAAVNAGARLADNVDAGINAALYLKGIEAAEALAMEKHGKWCAYSDSGQWMLFPLQAAAWRAVENYVSCSPVTMLPRSRFRPFGSPPWVEDGFSPLPMPRIQPPAAFGKN